MHEPAAASDRRFGLKYWRKTKALFPAVFLLTSLVTVAQSGPLAKSPAALPARAIHFENGLPQGLEAPAKLAPRQAFAGRSLAGPGADTFAPIQKIPNTGLEYAQGVHVDLGPLFAAMERPASSQPDNPSEEEPGRYSVKGLLWQSLLFTGVENGYRLSTDYFMRHQVADGPYWHNYFTSLQHWDMNRWSDGDDFLVDNIGHPMQGAVSAFIEIQNSPQQRVLRLSNTKEYWHSRFLALMWATVFSTQQKIGPLGEAALGNDGGYTYVPNCPFPCKSWRPGQTYLNNTGWTDFIMTPAGGTVWVVMEDFLDRKVSDRVQDAHPDSVFPLILRSALNPARSMANFMRWRTPWYRDYDHYDADRHLTPAVHFIPSDDDAVSQAPRNEIFLHYDAISLPVNTASCTGCRRMLPGYGVGFATRLTRWIDFDSDMDYHSDASPLPSDRAGGSMIMGTFGLRSGLQYAHYAVKAAMRPGFVSYSRAYETSPTTGGPTPSIGRVTHFATALAINADYDLSRHFALRGVLGNTPVRYLEPPAPGSGGIGTPPNLNWLSSQVFLTNENWAYQTGVVMRF